MSARVTMYRNVARMVTSSDLHIVHVASKVGDVIECNENDGLGYGPAFRVRSRTSLGLVTR